MYVEPSSNGTLRVTQLEFDTRSGRFEATLEIPAGTGKRSVMHLGGRAIATLEVATVTRTVERGGHGRAVILRTHKPLPPSW